MNSTTRENLKRCVFPMVAFFVYLFVLELFTWKYFNFISFFSFQLVFQVFAYITCWAFVLRKNKSDKHIWINYAAWALFASIGALNG